MRRRLNLFAVLAVLLLSGTTFASIANVYVAQAAAGGDTGADCANAHAVTFFNSSGNWGSGSSQIGPGTTVHLCGTITTEMAGQGSGSAGNPITILFEANAAITLPVCTASPGCLNLNGLSYITVDGGTNGLISNTSNGTGLATATGPTGIRAQNSPHLIVQNLTIGNLYQHATGSTGYADTCGSGCGGNAIIASGSNISITHNVCHDVAWCFSIGPTSAESNDSIDHNTFYGVDHGAVLGIGASPVTADSVAIHDNTFHDFSKWDQSNTQWHHDGVHVYAKGTTPGVDLATITNLSVYNNYSYGDWGLGLTAHIFIEGNVTGRVYNNLAIGCQGTCIQNYVNNGYITAAQNGNGTQTIEIYNNTITGSNTSIGAGVLFIDETNGVFKNNIVTGTQRPLSCALSWTSNCTFAASGLDYNIYFGNGTSSAFRLVNSYYNTLADWQTATGQEAHSLSTDPKLNSDGGLQPGSSAIDAGTSLSSLFTTDRLGRTRPQGAAWDIGAYEAINRPKPPSNLTIKVK